MLPSASPAYKCWICLAKRELSGWVAYQPQIRPAFKATLVSRAHSFRKGFATVRHSNKRTSGRSKSAANQSSSAEDSKPTIGIRERLRQWEAENPLPVRSLAGDEGGVGSKKNNLTRAMTLDLVDVEFDIEAAENHQPLFEGDDLVDLRSNGSDIQPGDMVELSADILRIQLLAVCLGTFNGYQHFYTNTGKWFTSTGLRTLFVVKHFVGKNTVQKLVEALPSTSGSPELLNVLQDLKAGPSRETGADLIQRMHHFQTEAQLVYQSSAAKLDNAHRILSGSERLMSLGDIAERLLHRSLKVKGKFPTAALYAVHMALMQNDAGFRPASMTSHTKSYLYTVASQSDIAILEKAEYHVRRFLRWKAAALKGRPEMDLEDSVFGQFILKARKAIDDSRASREWSPHGMLRSARAPVSPILPGWTSDDLEIIEFMHMWAATQRFSPVSRFHSVAASTLRALERYQDVEYLDESVGWTFLQEIGWIKPWEIQTRYRLRLPGLELERGGGVRLPQNHTEQLKPDLFAGQREEFTVKCFCIDAERATDIDDGVSLEPTETPGVYWVHVHVADPASRVRPGSVWAEQAAAQVQTMYIFGHFARMFEDEVIKDTFSLANGKPCLTFSAKVNDDGDLLEYKITPATLRDVIYISPEVVEERCGGEPWSPPPPPETFSVGKKPRANFAPERTMAKADDLSAKDVNDLHILSRLASRLHSKRLVKGAVPYFFPSPEAEVAFDGVEVMQTPDGFMRCNGDPSIHILYGRNQASMLVASTMQLAGEVAARWCISRGIPIPFRLQPRAAENMEALHAFADAAYPKLRDEQPLTSEDWRTFTFLSGGTDVSSQPGPNFAMGIDVYTKATSPLRRYSDLLVHWQVEAALLEERRLGKQLEGNTDDSFLPFPRATLEEEVFPLLRVRERHAKVIQSEGNREWMLQALLRGWKFGENSDLPKTFRFTVRMVISKRLARGSINWFDMEALMEPSGLSDLEYDGRRFAFADVKVGDVYEVELSDVNVYSKKITVKALGRVEQ